MDLMRKRGLFQINRFNQREYLLESRRNIVAMADIVKFFQKIHRVRFSHYFYEHIIK